MVRSETEFGELTLVKDMPGTVSDLDRLVEKNRARLSFLVARIGIDGRGALAGSAGKLDLIGGTFGPSAGGSSGGPGGGTGFLIAILVESEAVLGDLEDRLFSFLGGRNLILGASGAPAVGAGFLGNGFRNLILPFGGLLALALVVQGLALGGHDGLHAGSNEATEGLVEMTDLVTVLLAIAASDGKSLGLVGLVVVVVVVLGGVLSCHLAAVFGARLGDGESHVGNLKLVL